MGKIIVAEGSQCDPNLTGKAVRLLGLQTMNSNRIFCFNIKEIKELPILQDVTNCPTF